MQARNRPAAALSEMRFTINLASAEPPGAGALRIGLGLTAAVLLLVFVADGMAWQTARRRLGELEAGNQRVAAALARLHAPQASPRGTSVAAVNTLLARKAFSWTGFLTDLEEAVPPKIAITRISPRWEAGGGGVDLGGEAASLHDLAALLIALERAPRFADAFLGHQRMRPGPGPGNNEADNGVVEFSLHVRYAPPEGAR